METKNKKKPAIIKVKAAPKKRVSKTWKAAMKSQGSIEILDMEALFKPVTY